MNGATRLDTQRWQRTLRPTPLLDLGYLVLLVIALGLWLRGAPFYALSLAERIEHPDYVQLSPGRQMGRTYGLAGLCLLTFNLGYLLRKRFPHWPVGPMQLWLNLHVLSGLGAAVFALYHAAFRARSATAMVIAAGLAITIVTGLVGRFFHALGRAHGGELPARLASLEALLPGVTAPLQTGLARALAEVASRGDGLVRVAARVVRCRREVDRLRAQLRSACQAQLRAAAGREWGYVGCVVADVERLSARELHAALGRALLPAWRPWHRACALAVVAGVVLHVAIAMFYGYL